ncbi:MAG: hypothetical protein IKM18_00825 [Clostridia bacterium]|nr:hypothetical protein [Clostridia bacterium]
MLANRFGIPKTLLKRTEDYFRKVLLELFQKLAGILKGQRPLSRAIVHARKLKFFHQKTFLKKGFPTPFQKLFLKGKTPSSLHSWQRKQFYNVERRDFT